LALKLVHFIVHPLDLTVVVLAQVSHFGFEVLYLPVFAFLTLNKDNRMIKALFHEVGCVVLAHDFDFAAEFVVRTFYKLKLAYILVLLNMLSQSALTTFVVAFHNLKEATIIVCTQVFEDDNRVATMVGTDHPSECAVSLMLIELLSL
jgi:hypothetical protein